MPFTGGKWWYSFKTFPVRGWVKQQLIKLAIGEHLNEDYFLIVDSDIFFIKPFQLEDYVLAGKYPFYREDNEELSQMFKQWNKVAGHLLDYQAWESVRTCYVGPCIFWSKKYLQLLLQHIENICQRSWQEAVCRHLHISEYTIYGIFVDFILSEDLKNHYPFEKECTLNHYEEKPLSLVDLENLAAQKEEHHMGAMISAKSGTKASDIATAFSIDLTD